MSLTPEKELGKLEKGGGVPGIALATCGDLHTQRLGPRQDREPQRQIHSFLKHRLERS